MPLTLLELLDEKDKRIKELESQLVKAKRFLGMAFEYEGDVFGVHHNEAIDLYYKIRGK